MLNVDSAIELILTNTTVKEKSEITDIFSCPGRILFSDISAGFNVPYYNNSAMDGYAVLSEDLKNATKQAPVTLKIIDEIQAGNEFKGSKLEHGNAVRIMTGAPIPDGADSVIQFEETEESGDTVLIFKNTLINENIRFAGEDIKEGELVLKKGTRIDSAETGIIASLNLNKVPVYAKPEIGIISTGDEIAEPGSVYEGKIINSNAYSLFSEVKKYGGEPHYEGIVRDKYDEVKNTFLKLMKYDIIISSGGVSMGRYDFIPDVLKEIGIDIKVRKILMKPGKPVIFGTAGEKLFFGLPGNPVSVMVSFMQFVRPAILKMSGCCNLAKPFIKAELKENISKKAGRRHFIRGIFSIEDGKVFVSTTGPQGSGILTSMSSSNCLIIVPEETELIKKGEQVFIQLTGHKEI